MQMRRISEDGVVRSGTETVACKQPTVPAAPVLADWGPHGRTPECYNEKGRHCESATFCTATSLQCSTFSCRLELPALGKTWPAGHRCGFGSSNGSNKTTDIAVACPSCWDGRCKFRRHYNANDAAWVVLQTLIVSRPECWLINWKVLHTVYY